jgi:hypothetical protein
MRALADDLAFKYLRRGKQPPRRGERAQGPAQVKAALARQITYGMPAAAWASVERTGG